MPSSDRPKSFEPDIQPFLGNEAELRNRDTVPIKFFDTTLRDGEQAEGSAMSMDQKLFFADISARAGVDVHEVGFPASNTDMQNVREVSKVLRPYDVEVAGLARATRKDIEMTAEALQDARHPRIHTFLATSPIHLEKKLGITFEKALETIERICRFAKEQFPNMKLEFSPEDATRTEIGNLIIACRTAIEAGADVLNIPDTNGITNPPYVKWMFEQLIKNTEDLRRAGKNFEFSFHGHNDEALGVANALAAVAGGARQVEACWGDNGERAGNFPIEEVALALDKQGARLSADHIFVHHLKRELIIPTTLAIYEIMGRPVPDSKVLVGRRIALHGAGIHTDGSVKDGGILGNESTYNVVDVQKYGGGIPEKPVGSRAGAADILQALSVFGIQAEKPHASKVLPRVTEEAINSRRIFPAHVLFESSKVWEGLSNPNISRTEGAVEVTFDFMGRRHEFKSDIRNENSAIQALMAAISEFCEKDLDIANQSEFKQAGLDEIQREYARRTSSPLADKRSKGSEAMAVARVEVANGEKAYNVHLAGRNVNLTNLRAIFIASWPFIREKIIANAGGEPKELQLK